MDGHKYEPYEEAVVEVPEEHVGPVVDMLGQRKGQMLDLVAGEVGGLTRSLYLSCCGLGHLQNLGSVWRSVSSCVSADLLFYIFEVNCFVNLGLTIRVNKLPKGIWFNASRFHAVAEAASVVRDLTCLQ